MNGAAKPTSERNPIDCQETSPSADLPERLRQDAVELCWTANAYLDCAVRICRSLIEEGHEQSIHHNRVPLHLAFLGLELYFKAGIAAAGREYPKHHDLATLQTLYSELWPAVHLPIPKYFENLLPSLTRDMFDDVPTPDLQWHFSRLRYSADRRGQPFPSLLMEDVAKLRDELEEISGYTLGVQQAIWKKCGWKSR